MIRALQGNPAPSAFAVVSISGTTPVCSIAKGFPLRPIPHLHLVRDQEGAALVAGRAQGPHMVRFEHERARDALDGARG